MSSDDFSGVGLSIEPVCGARSFDVDSLGRLNAVSYDYVWRPGENEATCLRTKYHDALSVLQQRIDAIQTGSQLTSSQFTITGGVPVGPISNPSTLTHKASKKHDMSTCSCGFYSYFDNSADYHDAKRVNAVVEGYGETIIGSRGFRSKKARIVALHIPGASPPQERPGFRHAAHRWFYKHDFLSIALPLVAFLAAGLLTVASFDLGDWLVAAAAVVPFAAGMSCIKATSASFDCDCIPRRRSYSEPLAPELAEKVRRNYGGIPVYDTFEEMVAAHPLTAPPRAIPR